MMVGKVIEKFEYISDYRFVYNVRLVDLDCKIDVNLINVFIEMILNIIFKDLGIDFKVSGLYIVLIFKKVLVEKLKVEVQDFIVKGRVIDEKGMFLVGVVILDNGLGRGVQIDFNGEYQIIIVGSEIILVFVYLGYVRQEIKVVGRSVINVVFKEDIVELGEVVLIIGY